MILLLAACHRDGSGPILFPPGADPCETPGYVCAWLGVPEMGGLSDDGLHRTESWVYVPLDLTFGPDGTAWFVDYLNHRLRRVDPDGIVTTISGTGFLGDGPNPPEYGMSCWEGCDAASSRWRFPSDIQLDPDQGLLWVAAFRNNRVEVIDQESSTVTWWAGDGRQGYADGPREQAAFALPSSIAFDDGWIYVSDQANQVIRWISPEGEVGALAGQAGQPGYDGDGGPASEAHLNGGTGVQAPGSKLLVHGRQLLFPDTFNGVIRSIDLDTMQIETIAGRYTSAGANLYGELGSIPGYEGDGGPALDAVLARPGDIAVGPDGELYIADTDNNCVRVVRDGVIDTFAGICGERGIPSEGIPAEEARFTEIFGISVDGEGAVYVADSMNHVIWRIAPR